MTRVALLTPCFTEADAVSNDVRGMYRALSARGHEVSIFAHHWEACGLPVGPLSAARRFTRDPSAVVIYHHAAGWWKGVEALVGTRGRRVLKYHNITPEEFFESIDQEYVLSCRVGRRQLTSLARAGLDLYLADSAYNLSELHAEGVADSAGAVVAPFHNIDRLLELAPDPEILERHGDGRANVLVVGRLAPNKGHAALLDAFALYRRRYNPQSRLLVVGKGDDRLSVYGDAVRARAAALGLEDAVVFTGRVSDAALKAYYRTASVFVITSRHEGFCVPLVEAMALGVPVIALGTTAVPATVGGAGLVWEEAEADADLLAESMHRLITDRTTAAALSGRGWRRYQEEFANATIERSFLKALEGVL